VRERLIAETRLRLAVSVGATPRNRVNCARWTKRRAFFRKSVWHVAKASLYRRTPTAHPRSSGYGAPAVFGRTLQALFPAGRRGWSGSHVFPRASRTRLSTMAIFAAHASWGRRRVPGLRPRPLF